MPTGAIRLGLAIDATAAITAQCIATAFVMWCQDACVWHGVSSENPEIPTRLLARLARGEIMGGIALSNPLKNFSRIEPLMLRAVEQRGGCRVSGKAGKWAEAKSMGLAGAEFYCHSKVTMGNVTLITGGVRSGKSAYAVTLAGEAPPALRRFVIATGQALDDEMRERIARHRMTRPANFETVEEPIDLSAALSALEDRAGIVVLDCLTLWISNLLGQGLSDSAILAQADSLASALKSASFSVVVVSDEVGWGIVPENQLARRFRDLLGCTNQKIAAVADAVVLMVSGCGIRLKQMPRD